ncbi:MAG: hypothetical protein M0Q90_01890 [Bacteroidales bacterium]|nr:hypothetical protein [Bacteroidales bacterium]
MKDAGHRFRLAISACLLLAFYLTSAQTNQYENRKIDVDYSKFQSDFEKRFGKQEVVDLGDVPSNIDHVFLKTDLPDWITNLPQATEKQVYALGISDPAMDRDAAMSLAIHRAKAVCMLQLNTEMSGLFDYYISEKDLNSGNIISSVYNDFNRISSDYRFNTIDFNIINDTFTNNNEAIVLASMIIRKNNFPIADPSSMNCSIEVSTSTIRKNSKKTNTSRADFIAFEKNHQNENDTLFHYIAKQLDKKAAQQSFFEGKLLPTYSGVLTYQPKNELSVKDTLYLPEFTLEKGVWHAYFLGIVQSLILDFNESDVSHSAMTDEHTKTTQNLNRVLSHKSTSFRIKRLLIKNNKLQIETDFFNQN